MKTRFPLWILAALIVFIAIANSFADLLHLYYLLWWLDIPMHILGGVWVALFGLVYYYRFAHVRKKDHSLEFVFTCAIAVTLTVGLGWEIYEWTVAHVVMVPNDGVFDALKDLSDDLAGALIAASIFIKGGYHKAP